MMTGEAADRSTPAAGHWTGDELLKALLLLRAANLRAVRFQLACATSDRRGALDAMDGFTAIDADFQRLIDSLPIDDPALAELARRGGEERASLASEKLALVGEVGNVRTLALPPADNPGHEADETAPDAETESHGGRWGWWLLAFVLLAIGGGLAVLVLLGLAPIGMIREAAGF